MTETPWFPTRSGGTGWPWWEDGPDAPPWIAWVDGNGLEQIATLQGRWDGTTVQPGIIPDYLDGGTERRVGSVLQRRVIQPESLGIVGRASPSEAVPGTTPAAGSTDGAPYIQLLPSGTQVGDLLIAQVGYRSASSITPPAGWSLLASAASAYPFTQYIFTRLVAANEPSYEAWMPPTAEVFAVEIVALHKATLLGFSTVKAEVSNTTSWVPHGPGPVTLSSSVTNPLVLQFVSCAYAASAPQGGFNWNATAGQDDVRPGVLWAPHDSDRIYAEVTPTFGLITSPYTGGAVQHHPAGTSIHSWTNITLVFGPAS